ncbi:HAD family phosphatase [Treponema parvum]|uniref:HAD family phosphatase n=1 Tax=Treponema parvum TaxID=138851 RepID=A0A975IDH2_9SPIR|nr:HAD family phosphatase [Treponema parvum]QTQ12164.1 HAD family phosphatase [Treponema parvum]QTQ15846.1 HAD family phosphatase [Treponema parvum]
MLFIFDMGGVCITSASLEEQISASLNISVEQAKEYAVDDKGRDMMQLLSDGVITVEHYWKEFSKKLGRPITADYWRLALRPNRIPEVYEIIGKLIKNKHRVVCGTNTISSHYDCHLARNDYGIFDMTYASHQMGVSKPDPRFWQLILKFEKTEAQDTFFIDDRQENVEAAAKLGIQTHRFTTASNLEDALKNWL